MKAFSSNVNIRLTLDRKKEKFGEMQSKKK